MTTAHEFQNVGNPWEQQFREMLPSVVNTYDIQIILEEWNENPSEPLSEAR